MKERLARKLVHFSLRSKKRGRLTLAEPGRKAVEYGDGETGVNAHLDVHESDFFRRIAFHGDIGLGEAYSEGLWDSPNLVELFTFLLDNNAPARNTLERQASRFLGTLKRARHQLAPPNTESGSRQNISAHYDLSNDLFALFLDSTMTYSSAVFEDPCDPHEELELAQERKYRMLADKVAITPDDHVLEIGCGWGGFAEQVARERGCRMTCVTVSEQQYAFASERVRKAGLEDRVEIRLQDYRRIEEQFDKIVSIEMLEAVGHEFHGTYFQTIDRLLKPGGLAAIQVITIQDGHYEQYRRNLDWIRKHIFPGGTLPSLTRICSVCSSHTPLIVQNVEAIGPHYANTLRRWRHRFNENREQIRELGFDDYFLRTWDYYLAICEAGFINGHINDLMVTLTRAEPKATLLACCQKGMEQ